MSLYIFLFFALFLLVSIQVRGGPLAYGICQTGCNTLCVACYASAGVTFGTVTVGAGTPAIILGCNAGLGFCMASFKIEICFYFVDKSKHLYLSHGS